MNHILWHSTSRQAAARILCGGKLSTLMQDGPYGYGLYLHPDPQLTSEHVVGLQFELSEDVELTYRGVGWEPVETIALPNDDMMFGFTDSDGIPMVCVYNSTKLRLIAITC